MSYANRILGSIPYGTLIGAPMTAAVEAQALSAQTSIDFIRSIGFESTEDGTDFGAVRQVTFSYSRRDTTTGEETDVSLKVPLHSTRLFSKHQLYQRFPRIVWFE